MPEQDWALERARKILRNAVSGCFSGTVVIPSAIREILLNGIAEAIREERHQLVVRCNSCGGTQMYKREGNEIIVLHDCCAKYGKYDNAHLQRAEAAEKRAADDRELAETWQRIIEDAETQLGVRTNCAIGTALPEGIDALKKRAAALEAVVLDALGDNRCGRCSLEYPVWRCWRCTAAAALRDHSGALSQHDAEVRHKALVEAAGEILKPVVGFPGESIVKQSISLAYSCLMSLAETEVKP